MEVAEKAGPQGLKIFELSGVIDETVDFSLMKLPDSVKSFQVDLYGIKRINSVGIKKWMMFFESIKKKNLQFSFARVSPAIVEQIVGISNFSCGGTVVSVVLPFACKACGTQNFFVKTKEELSGVNVEKVTWPCQSCNKPELEFDDLADEYLGFWGI